MCVNNRALSGHYYATGRSRPPRTNPVSIDSFIARLLYVSFNFVINKVHEVERCLLKGISMKNAHS